MDNKDQLNQIPGEKINENQDEKTSKIENEKVEAPQQNDENQETTEVKSENETPTDEVPQEETVSEEVPQEETVSEEVVETIEPLAQTGTEEVSAGIENVEATQASDEVPELKTEATVDEPIGEKLLEEEKAEQVSIPEDLPAAEVEPEVADEVEPEVAAELPEANDVGQPVGAETTVENSEKEALPVEEPKAVIQEEEVKQDEPSKETETGVEEKQETAAEEVVVKDDTLEKQSEEENDDDDDDDEEEHEVEKDEVIDYETLSREELVGKLEVLVAEDDVNRIKSKISLIKVNYLKKTKAEKEALIDKTLSKEKDDDQAEVEEVAEVEDTLEAKFNEFFDIYKQKRSVFLENLEKEKVENLQKKKDILDALKNLISSEETLKKTYDDFRDLQGQWKDIGMVPKAEVNNLWQNYHFLVEKFFDKVKINKELKDLDLKKNLEQKIELCEQAEELLLENSIIRSFKELQRLHDSWKDIGPVPTDKNEDLWERFKSTTDKINQRRRDHYNQLQDQHDTNYEAKVGLCEKAEQLLAAEVNSIREWQNKTKQFNELFKVWKSIGPAAKRQNDEIWEKFKAVLDGFFNEKKEYFGKLKDQQINNYNIKLDLCVRAEAVKDSTDWRQTSRELINMQKEWKEVGPVPRKHSDKIWKRFREACDEFFNNKSNHFAHQREDETENLNKKEELIKQVEESAFDGDRGENLNKLKEFQRQWTDIGFVPFKDKDRLQNAFRSAVNKQLDKLNISSSEITMDNYKSKMEVLKGSPDGNKSLGRERNFIMGKITSLRDDINVWENNIGFLADTKKASLFKDEFEKKIDKAKKELEVLETKLKFLSN